jgi:transglutaminase-like putative cysteine protease
VAGNRQVPWLEQYSDMQQGTIHVQMLKPPAAGPDIFFYPGMLTQINRQASLMTRSLSSSAVSTPAVRPVSSPRASPRVIRLGGLPTVDRARGLQGNGAYSVTVLGSNATEDQLRQAGTDYPGWVQPYRNFFYSSPVDSPGPTAYRPPAVLARIHQLALQVTAGTTNPYDAAAAIETYLRSNYKYTLKPPLTPAGQDPMAFFLFDSKQGYCEYFASAMGDMLRSLGIPVRLVSGYGPGTFDDKLNRYVVRESDAHIWPEIYVPSYGWIAFEPTADGVYTPVTRGSVSGTCRGGAENCGGPSQGGPGAGSLPQTNRDPGAVVSGGGARARAAGTQPFHWELVLLGIALVLMAMGLVASRWLRPRTVGGAWRRTGVLARLAGVSTRPGETPIEFGERLAVELPEAAAPARELASHFTVAAYAPIELAGGVRDAALSAWRELRPHLLRGIPRHLRPRR